MSNILSVVHPELVAEWSEKNLPLTPDSITFGSNKKVWCLSHITRKTLYLIGSGQARNKVYAICL